ncbi:hypothetical protein [Pseudohongiella acticola]|uniref:hypothetical protein n=1 Tax=Pseudohongiella acticola TaxID=1524254 RepID=UPI0030ED99DD
MTNFVRHYFLMTISRRYRLAKRRRTIERAMRDAGYSRSQATNIARIIGEA